MITYVNPLVAVLLGVALLSEPFTLGIAVGMPLILLGSVLGTMPSLRRAQDPPPEDELEAGPPAPYGLRRRAGGRRAARPSGAAAAPARVRPAARPSPASAPPG